MIGQPPDQSAEFPLDQSAHPSSKRPHGRLSIGALSRATGIPVETLRTWEQRYGFPVPERKPSGHRSYATSIVPRLRRVAEALARGHRASDAVGATDAELARLLETTAPPPAAPTPSLADDDIGPFLRAVADFDADRLTRMLLVEHARLSLIDFLTRRVAPLVSAIGEAWSEKRLEVRHEHFLSERIGDVLRALRLPFEDRARGPLVVFATPPGEAHGLGLQMASLVVASAGCRVLFLGTDTPVDQIAALASDINARAVAISLSQSTSPRVARRRLTELRRQLPRRVSLIAGGDGAPRAHEVVTVMTDFRRLEAWARQICAM
jgi:MerR family transcriptional regulator, light-induced transcriptional regulator